MFRKPAFRVISALLILVAFVLMGTMIFERHWLDPVQPPASVEDIRRNNESAQKALEEARAILAAP